MPAPAACRKHKKRCRVKLLNTALKNQCEHKACSIVSRLAILTENRYNKPVVRYQIAVLSVASLAQGCGVLATSHGLPPFMLPPQFKPITAGNARGFCPACPCLDRRGSFALRQCRHPQIIPVEGQLPVHPPYAGGELGGIPLCHLFYGQVGGDDGVTPRLEAAIHHLIQGGLAQGAGELTAQIVQDQQVAAQVTPGVVRPSPASREKRRASKAANRWMAVSYTTE